MLIPVVNQITNSKGESFVIVLRRHFSFGRCFVRMEPVTVRETVRRIVAHHRIPFVAIAKAALQLNRKLENPPALQFETDPQGIVDIHMAVKFDEAHDAILQADESVSQT